MSEPALKVSTRTHDGNTVLALAGEIDMNTVPLLLAAVDDALGAGATVVVIDGTAITFADSSALQGLLGARAAATERGAKLQLAQVSDQMGRTLSLAGLDDFFDPVDP